MLACVECKKEMQCHTNGVGLDWGHGHVYPADVYICPICGKKTAYAERSILDKDYDMQVEYIKMVKP